jgi:hypothetical protein
MAVELTQFNMNKNGDILNEIEHTLWPMIKDKMRGPVWEWFDENKDRKVTTIFRVFPIYVGSFGIAAAVIGALIGPRPVPQPS